jgi:hypothetical protein
MTASALGEGGKWAISRHTLGVRVACMRWFFSIFFSLPSSSSLYFCIGEVIYFFFLLSSSYHLHCILGVKDIQTCI